MKFLFRTFLFAVLFAFVGVSWGQSSELNGLYDKFDKVYASKRIPESIAILKEMLALEEIELGVESAQYFNTLTWLSSLYAEAGDVKNAEITYKRTLALAEKKQGKEHLDLAPILLDLSQFYVNQGRYVDAKPIFQRVISIEEKFLGKDHEYVGIAVHHLAIACTQLGHYEEAERHFRRALELYEYNLGPNHAELANVLTNFAILYRNLSRFDEAEKLYRQALIIAENSLGLAHPTVGIIKGYIASLNSEQGKALFEVMFLFREALTTIEQALGPYDPGVATMLMDMSSAYQKYRLYAEAEPLLQRASKIYKKTYGSNHPNVAMALHNMGALYEAQADYDKAEATYRKVLEIRKNAFGLNHPDSAMTLSKIANMHYWQARYMEAELLYKQTLNIQENVYGVDHPNFALTLHNLAFLYVAQARHVEAESLYKKSINIAETRLGAMHPDVASGLDNLGRLYSHLGRFDEARSLFKRALEIRIKTFGLNNAETASSLNSLALSYMSQALYAEAEPLFHQALKIWGSIYGTNHPNVGAVINHLATLYRKQGAYDQVESFYMRALKIDEQTFGIDHPHTVEVLTNLGLLYEATGRLAEAESMHKRILLIDEKQPDPDSLNRAITMHNLSFVYREQGRFDEAEDLLRQAIRIAGNSRTSGYKVIPLLFHSLARIYEITGRNTDALESIRQGTTLLRERFTGQKIKETHALVREQRSVSGLFISHVDIALHSNQAEGRGALETEAFEVIQLARKNSTAGALARMAARFATGNNEMARLIREQQDGLAHTEKLNQELIKAVSVDSGVGITQRITNIRAELQSLEERSHKLNQTIEEMYPKYAELTSRNPISLKEVTRLLAPNEALLSMIQSFDGDQIHLFILRSNDSQAYSVEFKIIETEGLVSQLRSGIDPATGQIKAFDVGLSHELYRRLLSPAEPMLAGVDHLFVVPDGPLESLPFHLLVTEDPGEVSLPGLQDSGQRGFTVVTDSTQVTTDTDVGYQDIAWLAKKYAITTLPSVASLRALRVFAKRAEATEPFIGFGDPVLGGQSGESKGLQVASFYRGAVADVDEVRQLSSLPETETELRAIAQYLGANDNAIYLRERATESQVKSVALNQSKVVAFATHGLVSGELKGLAEPALVLTPPETGTEHDDGLLTASEVAQLKLDADWVILSACNTAAGDKPGATGLSGLAKAFFYAGARALLVSHWPVESNAATALTTNMFQKLKQNPLIGRAEALRQSMMALAGNPKTAHPFFWAPFVVVGEGGELVR
jgi:tetratricopeptide (TPR) repeat protein